MTLYRFPIRGPGTVWSVHCSRGGCNGLSGLALITEIIDPFKTLNREVPVLRQDSAVITAS
jgi:hypothetical protein